MIALCRCFWDMAGLTLAQYAEKGGRRWALCRLHTILTLLIASACRRCLATAMPMPCGGPVRGMRARTTRSRTIHEESKRCGASAGLCE